VPAIGRVEPVASVATANAYSLSGLSPASAFRNQNRDRSNRWLCARALCICGYFIDYRYRFLEASASLLSICLYGLDALSRIPRKFYNMTRRSDPHRWINAEAR
jgi:hypothetical protein